MAPVEPPPAGSVMTYEQLRQAKMQATQRAFAELQSLSADLTQETRRQAGENQQQKQPRRTWTRRKLFDKVRRSGSLPPFFSPTFSAAPLLPCYPNSPATQYLELDDRTPECSTEPLCLVFPLLPTLLQNSPVTQYVELDDKTPERSTTRRTRAWQLRPMGSAGSAEAGTVVRCGKEVYTEEDLRKLRGHVKPYDISVERFKNRVYDPVNGKTCHQCRRRWGCAPIVRRARINLQADILHRIAFLCTSSFPPLHLPLSLQAEDAGAAHRVCVVQGLTCKPIFSLSTALPSSAPPLFLLCTSPFPYRQKTLGLRTECAACKDRSVCGQFCGDCLFVRYGENIEEALADPTWECPVCRDICNCSICRNRKGWGPTGPLFHKVWGAGYQSVAHYLMLTRMVKDGESTGARADGGVEGGSGSEEGGEAEGGSDGAGGESGENDEEGGCEEEGGQDGNEVTLIEECKDGNEKARKRKREVERSAVETRGRKQGLGRKKECVIMKGEEEDEKEKEEDDEDVVEIQVCRTVVQVKEEREEGEVEGVSEIEWTKMTAVEEEGVEEGEVERKEEQGVRRKGQVKVKTENTTATCGKKTFGGSSIWGIKGGSLVEIATGAGAGSEVKREEREVKRESGIMTRRAAARMEAEAAKLKAAHGRVLRPRTIHVPQTGGAAAGGGRAGMGKGVAAAVGDSKKGTKSGLKLVMRSAVKGMGKRGGREEVEEDKAQLRHLQKEEDSDSDDDVVEVVVARTV
ncbi:unnamed protein product [Closterium sp. NIES-65]|nr:unnamed protein product [Closterium sp. NIES-65]